MVCPDTWVAISSSELLDQVISLRSPSRILTQALRDVYLIEKSGG
jgi:hypothetical protein